MRWFIIERIDKDIRVIRALTGPLGVLWKIAGNIMALSLGHVIQACAPHDILQDYERGDMQPKQANTAFILGRYNLRALKRYGRDVSYRRRERLLLFQ